MNSENSATFAEAADEDWEVDDYVDLDVPWGAAATGPASRRRPGSQRREAPSRDPADYLTKREFLSKTEAGEIVGLNPKTIERVIQRGELRAYKLASKVRISRDDLEAWIEASEVTPSVHDI